MTETELKKYLDRPVIVETTSKLYLGTVFSYDSTYLTLNPYTKLSESVWNSNVPVDSDWFYDNVENKSMTLNHTNIKSIEELVFDDLDFD
jgi:hypothetical protein